MEAADKALMMEKSAGIDNINLNIVYGIVCNAEGEEKLVVL